MIFTEIFTNFFHENSRFSDEKYCRKGLDGLEKMRIHSGKHSQKNKFFEGKQIFKTFLKFPFYKGFPWGIGILKNMENDMKNNVEKVWMNSKRWESTQETIPKKINFLRPTKFSKNFWNSHFIKDFLKDNDLEYIRGGQNPKSGITVKDMRKRTLPGDSSSKSVILIF